jgi:hypothetical protein
VVAVSLKSFKGLFLGRAKAKLTSKNPCLAILRRHVPDWR